MRFLVVVIALAGLLAAAAHAGASPRSAPATKTDAGSDLIRRYLSGVLLIANADNTMRHCDSNAGLDCDSAINDVENYALTWQGAIRRVPSSGLSPLGRRVQANAAEGFRRYYLAAATFKTGSYSGYLAQLKQAIGQESAAATRLGNARAAWFNYVMVTNGCVSWRLALRSPGLAVCD